MRYRMLALVFGVVTVVAWTSAWSQTKKLDAQKEEPKVRFAHDTDGMRGIKTVVVLAEPIKALEGLLDAATLEAGVELRLRQNGITVASKSEKEAYLYPEVYLNCNVIKGADGTFAYNILLSFQRWLRLPDSDETNWHVIHATVWESSMIGTVGGRDVAVREIRGDVDDQVSKFLTAYLAVNPK